MALPWLIGALVVGIAAKVLSSDSDDDKESRADRDREERRREELSGFCEVIYHKENTYSQEMSDGVYLRNYCLSG